MEIYCLEDFKSEFLKLKKNNSYRDLEKLIITSFFGKKSTDFFRIGTRLNGTNEAPFIRSEEEEVEASAFITF
jgi:hypothetical protein